jgi:DNA-binding MarR family transcriptional regulator
MVATILALLSHLEGNTTMPINAQLTNVLGLLEHLRGYEERLALQHGKRGTVPLQLFSTLILVAQKPGITMAEIAARLGIAQSTVSRNIAALGPLHRLKKEGLGFVDAVEQPLDRRQKVCYLTPKGRSEVNVLVQYIDPEFRLEAPTAKEAMKGVWDQIRAR